MAASALAARDKSALRPDLFLGPALLSENADTNFVTIGFGVGVGMTTPIVTVQGSTLSAVLRPNIVIGGNGTTIDLLSVMVPVALQLSSIEEYEYEDGTTRFGASVAVGAAFFKALGTDSPSVIAPYVACDLHLGLVRQGSLLLRYQGALATGSNTRSIHGLYLVGIVVM